VVTYHGVISPKIIDKKFKEVNQLNIPVPLIKFFFGFIYKLSARYIDKAIVHENYFKKVLVNDYGFADNQVDVIHHGIEERSLTLFQKEAREKLKISQDKKVILFFGFLAGYKGVDLLLDTFQLLDENQYFLILAGGKPKRVEKDRSYNAWFEGLESRIKGSQNILQTGFVPDDQIDLYFSASDVLVLPYLQMLSASGPMSFALSFGKPFLASDVFREVLENDKLIFQRNKESLKRSIELFFGNQSDFNDYIKERKAERSWDRIGQQTFTLYSHVAHLSA
jgi:glycosyltransferase involved in cell wall biosynthesis